MGLCATSSHQIKDQEGLIDEAKHLLESWGLRVVLQDSILERHFYLAGRDEHRAKEFIKLYTDSRIKAMFFTRGGYGSARLLRYFDADLFRKNKKILVGLSDVTTLLHYFQKVCDMVVFHGPCLATSQFLRSEDKEKSQQSLYQYLFDNQLLSPFEVVTLKEGNSQGILTGGCLSILVTLLGTPHEIETEGTILFLEDINEEPYRIDRMLTHLRNAGKLEGLHGLVFGEMTGCLGKEGLLWEMLKDYFHDAEYPVVYGVPSGHGKYSVTLPLGAMAAINTDQHQFRLLETGMVSPMDKIMA